MRHYEIVLLVHPDQSEQVPSMLDRYRGMVETNGGQVHRSEDWGRLQLAYTIAKLHKAHYLMLNVECGKETLDELEGVFRFNDAILRHLIVRKDKAETEPSVMLKRKENKDEREGKRSAPEDEEHAASEVSPDSDDTEQPEESGATETGTEATGTESEATDAPDDDQKKAEG